MAGPWEKYGGASQPQALPVIQGPPKLPAPQTPAQSRNDDLTNILLQEQIEEKRRKQQEEAQQRQALESGMKDTQAQLASVIRDARKAQEMSNQWFASGVGSGIAKQFEGTNARDLSTLLNRVGSNTAFDRLQKMRDESPTGGALGQVSNIELQLLKDSVGSLDQGASDEQFRTNLQSVIDHYRRIYEKIGGDPALLDAQDEQPLDDEGFRSEIERRISSGADPAETIQWLIEAGRPPNKETIDAIIANAGNRRPDVRPPDGGDDGGIGRSLGVGVRGVAQGVGDIANLVSSPVIQGVNAVAGTNFNPDMGANLGDMLGLPQPQSGAEHLAHEANRFGTGGATIAGLSRRAAPYIGNALGQGLQRIGNAPLTDTFSGFTAGLSGEGARQAGAGPIGQGAAALAGGAAAIPVAIRAGSSRLANHLSGGPDMPAPAIVQAGQQERVTVNRAMIDPDTQQRVTAVGKTMVGGKKMQRDMRQVGDEIEAGVKRLGANGEVLEPSVGGQRLQAGLEKDIKVSGQQFRRRYDAVEKAAEGVKVPPKAAMNRTDEVIAKLSETPETNKAELTFLQSLKNDFTKDLSVGALRRMRTSLRKRISKGELTFGENEADVLSIMDAASEDIANGLAAAGKRGVAAQFKAVDADYRKRMEFIQGTVQKIIGRRGANYSPEKIISNLKAMTGKKGDVASLAKVMRVLDPEDQADFAATIVDELGKNKDGSFSTALLTGHLEKIPRAAKVAVFGPEGAKSLDNLQMLAKEHKRVSHALGGSPTGVGNDYRSVLWNLVFGGAAFAQGGVNLGSAALGAGVTTAGLSLKAGRDLMNARLLMSPDIQKWLRTAPRTANPKAINHHFDRLKAIAVRQPALAPDIEQLQQTMMRAANENVATRAAADKSLSDDEDRRQGN